MILEPSNEDRAAWASAALDKFAAECRMQHEDRELQLSDLLCDLMHLCNVADIDWATCINRAEGHYREEVFEGSPQ